DDLNRKLSQRPGVKELLVKNFLPAAAAQDPPTAEQGNDPKVQDVYNRSDSLAAAEQTSEQTQEPTSTAVSSESSPSPAGLNHAMLVSSDSPRLGCTAERQSSHAAALEPFTSVAHPVRGSVLVKQSQPRTGGGEKNRGKKGSKDPKSRVKKLKYHQYVPPDQKQESSHGASLDSACLRLLQQQQQFLQLQVLDQQHQASMDGGRSDGLAHSKQTPPPRVSHHFPYSLDDMKVAELKAELKLRGLLVSGTKNNLIERLRWHHDTSRGSQPALVAIITTTVPKFGNTPRPTPPVSPVAFEVSVMGLDERLATDPETHSFPPGHSPHPSSTPGELYHHGVRLEKDQRLHEKERQIEELIRQLEREQKLVEELKMQLEAEKRGHRVESSSLPVLVKEECCGSPVGLPGGIEPDGPSEQNRQSPPHHFFSSHQWSPQTQTMQQGSRLLQPGSTVKLPDNRRSSAHTGVDDNQTQRLLPQKHGASGSLQQCNSPSPRTQSSPLSVSPGLSFQAKASQSQDKEETTQHLLNTAPVPTAFSQHMEDLFDVLIESGEITPFIRQDHDCVDKPYRVGTANVTTLAFNTAMSRPRLTPKWPPTPDATLSASS
ncbi:hypothetical protein CRUP_016143, partial [Coryphaenoides rupestris]